MELLQRYTDWKTIHEGAIEFLGSDGGKLNMMLQPTSYLRGGSSDLVFETVDDFLNAISDKGKHTQLLKKATDPAIHYLPEFRRVAHALHHLVESVRYRESDIVRFDAGQLQILKESNLLGLIEKNFGEILSAVYYCTMTNESQGTAENPAISFPSSNQTPLIDFYYFSKPVSVKSHIGANASSFFTAAKYALSQQSIRESINEKSTSDPRFGKIVNILDEVEDVIGKPTFWNKYVHLMDVFEIELESVKKLAKIDRDYDSHTSNPFGPYLKAKSLTSISNITVDTVWDWMRKFIYNAGAAFVSERFSELYSDILGTTFSTPIEEHEYAHTHAQGLILMESSKRLNGENSFAKVMLNDLLSSLNVERCRIQFNTSESTMSFDIKHFKDMQFRWFVKANASRAKDISLNFMELE